MKKRIIAMLTCMALLLSIIYFVPDSDAGVSTLNLTNFEKTINEGQSFQIKLNGLKASKVKWSSSKKTVATVSKKGLVKGISSGNAKITGKYKGIKFTVKVKVVAKGDSFSPSSKPSETDQFIYSDDKVEFYYVGVSESSSDEYNYVDFRVINKINKTSDWGFEAIYINGKQAPSHLVDTAMPNMETIISTEIPKGEKPKYIKGILYSYLPANSKTIYSKEFTFTVK